MVMSSAFPFAHIDYSVHGQSDHVVRLLERLHGANQTNLPFLLVDSRSRDLDFFAPKQVDTSWALKGFMEIIPKEVFVWEAVRLCFKFILSLHLFRDVHEGILSIIDAYALAVTELKCRSSRLGSANVDLFITFLGIARGFLHFRLLNTGGYRQQAKLRRYTRGLHVSYRTFLQCHFGNGTHADILNELLRMQYGIACSPQLTDFAVIYEIIADKHFYIGRSALTRRNYKLAGVVRRYCEHVRDFLAEFQHHGQGRRKRSRYQVLLEHSSNIGISCFFLKVVESSGAQVAESTMIQLSQPTAKRLTLTPGVKEALRQCSTQSSSTVLGRRNRRSQWLRRRALQSSYENSSLDTQEFDNALSRAVARRLSFHEKDR